MTHTIQQRETLWPRPGPILVAVDPFAEEAMALLHDALELAQSLQRHLLLLYVLEPLMQANLIMPVIPDIEEKRYDQAETKFQQWKRTHAPSAEILILHGNAWSEISRVASEQSAALLVIGRGSAGDGISRLIGSTAERVVRHADVPVLVIAQQDRPLAACAGSVMLCTDRSEASLASFPYAVAYARLRQTTITLVCVEDPMSLPGEHEYEIFHEEIDAKRAAHDDALLAFRHLHLPADMEVETKVVEGAPHRSLCKWAAKLHVRLLVIANHGRSAWQLAMIGSTTERVVRHAECSVLVVPDLRRGTTEQNMANSTQIPDIA